MQRTAIGLVMCLPLLVGCAGEIISDAPQPKGTGGSGAFIPGGSGGASIQPGSGGARATGGAGSPTGPSSGSGGGGGGSSARGSGGASGSEPGSASGGLPCEVDAVLRSKCQSCHGAVPLNGAPVPIVTYEDTQAHAVSSPAMSVWQVMQTRVHSATMSVMPPRNQPALTSAELATLDAWFSAGAPAGTKACVSGGAGGTGGPSGAGGSRGISTPGVGPEYLPCKPTHYFRAHAEGSSTAKYPVPNPSQDSYICFNFKSPFAPGEQATAWAPITDDARVVHHWILYGTNAPLTDGTITNNCEITTLLATHVAGWAPGGENAVFDPDVGLSVEYPYYQLQVHYNNQRYNDAADSSGVAFCSTTTPRQNTAGIVVLGNMLFSIPSNANDYPVTNNCTNLSADGKTPLMVVNTSPHMHLLGTGFRTQHMRGGMDMGDLSNIPLGTWSFDGQKAYAVAPRRQVLPGDTLKTTCYYDNPNPNGVNFGPKTSDEMCFNFLTVYPYAAATKTCMSLF